MSTVRRRKAINSLPLLAKAVLLSPNTMFPCSIGALFQSLNGSLYIAPFVLEILASVVGGAGTLHTPFTQSYGPYGAR